MQLQQIFHSSQLTAVNFISGWLQSTSYQIDCSQHTLTLQLFIHWHTYFCQSSTLTLFSLLLWLLSWLLTLLLQSLSQLLTLLLQSLSQLLTLSLLSRLKVRSSSLSCQNLHSLINHSTVHESVMMHDFRDIHSRPVCSSHSHQQVGRIAQS